MELNDVYVTSDTHFGHRKVSESRGFTLELEAATSKGHKR